MATLTVTATKDNYFYSQNPTTNNGTAPSLFLRSSQGGAISRAVVTFDISDIPTGSTITSATLSVYYYSKASEDPSGKNLEAVKLRRDDWHETESTWNIYKTSNNWGTGGARNTTTDIDTSLSSSSEFPASYGWMYLNVKSLVEDALSNSVNLNLCFSIEETGLESMTNFYSREYTDNTSLRPKLVIEYTSGTNMQVNVGGTMKSVSAAQINVGGNWKNVVGKQVNVNNTWKNI